MKGFRRCEGCNQRVEYYIIDPRAWLWFFGCKCKKDTFLDGENK